MVSPANETDIALSPDGHWLAYSSDETGRVEVYVRPVPGPGPRIAVSVDGGTQPLWSRDGGRLYYRGAGWMRSASIVQRPEFVVTRRESLFVDTYLADAEGINYAVTPDSRGFLMLSGTSQPNPTRLEVMLNWPSLVARTRATELR